MVNTRASQARAAKASAKQARASRKRKGPSTVGAPKKARKAAQAVTHQSSSATAVLPGGRIPPWQTLPYHILLSTFKHAAYPLLDDDFRRNASVSWLIGASTVCRAFCEPALSALYESPPITLAHDVRCLDTLLRSNGSSRRPRAVAYANKIHQLNLHIEHTRFAKISPDVEHLLPLMSGLRGLGLFSYHDDPRNIKEKGVKIICDPQYHWLNGLELANIHLTRLHINGFAISSDTGGPASLLASVCFRNLSELSLSSMSAEWLSDLAHEDTLRRFPHLKRLTFMRCGFGPADPQAVANEETRAPAPSILERIPRDLTYLSFVQCTLLRSQELTAILRGCGARLKELELRHNDYLDLRFITELASCCPLLERLCYDVSLFSPLIVSSHEPEFAEMLAPEDTPTWPRTLQRIEMIQLRQWEASTAEAFFKSLMSSAAELQDLRRIDITASVGAGWRERASFREKIIGPIYKVFERPRSEPSPNSRITVRTDPTEKTAEPQKHAAMALRETRRSGRLSDAAAPEVQASPPRRSARQRELKNSPDRAGASSQQSQTLAGTGRASSQRTGTKASITDKDSKDEIGYVQGKCDHVYVRVDNLRPAEEQLNEADFLDSERSGDEAWDPARGDIDDD